MRDLNSYQKIYNKLEFESYMVKYRREKILEMGGGSKRILEIGCGMEPLFKYLNNFEFYCIYEPSMEFYHNAKTLADTDTRIKVINEPFHYEKKIKENNFDFIVCASLLHEIDDPISFLQDIKRITIKNTIIHINVPNANSFHRILAKKMGLIDNCKELSERNRMLQQKRVFDINSLKNLLELAGLNVVDYGYIFVKPFTHKQMHDMLLNDIIDELVLEGLRKMVEDYPELGAEIWVNCRSR